LSIAINFKSKLKFAFYLIFHPLNGYWELKREKKGDVYAASLILLMLVIIYILRRQITGFIFNYNIISQMNLLVQVTSVVIPFLLWCVANWCITTLVDGEGSIKDIYIASAYAFIPIVLLNIPMLILSRVLTVKELSVYTLIDGIAYIWTGFLMLTGIMTIHQFSLKKTILTIFIAILTMAIMVFLFMLFFSVIAQMINVVLLIYKEITF
jgi:hypothetical protein